MLLPAVVLAAAGVGLAAATAVTAHRPSGVVPDLAGFLRRWSAVHDGYDAASTRLVRGWLASMYRVACPLAAIGVKPDVLTAWAVWLALLVVALAAAGGGWLVAAGILVLVSGVGDALDGAVAVLTDRATAWGYVLDSLADRLSDAVYLVAVWVAGAPAWLAVTCGITLGMLEYLRARAGNAGARHVATITVGERPQRMICCAIALGLAGAVPGRAALLAGLSLAILLCLSGAGLVQLAVSVRRQLET